MFLKHNPNHRLSSLWGSLNAVNPSESLCHFPYVITEGRDYLLFDVDAEAISLFDYQQSMGKILSPPGYNRSVREIPRFFYARSEACLIRKHYISSNTI